MKLKKCYMCEKEAVSVEHVPPKCLFPAHRDIGTNLRSNLITVPSCHEHNSAKSADDEFLMVSLAGVIGNNSIGYQHYTGKIQRALKRASYKLLDEVFLKKKQIHIHDDNKYLSVIFGTPDYKRLVNCFTHIGYGVHLHHFNRKFIGTIKPYLGHLYHSEKNPKTFKALITEKANLELANKEKNGENPQVFYYQFTDTDEHGFYLARLCFYENIHIYLSFMPESSTPPFNLGIELMNSGIKTHITLGDKRYEFN